MIHLIFVTKYRKKDRNNLKLHRKIAPKWGRSFLIKSVKLDPFAECDAILKILIYLVNPHLPCGRWRSICPMRRRNGDFNPHLPCRRWQQACSCTLHISRISIHTFLAEGDGSRMSVWRAIPNFNPHLLCRRWRLANCIFNWAIKISIHTFLAEGDNFNVFSSSNDSYFNPHLPCGRWHASGTIGITLPDFNPHLPCGRWLLLSAMAISASDFNPHLPCGRWRSGRIDRRCRDCTFQSTPSLRKVTTPLADICNCRRISIHTFLAEGDEDQYRICKRLRISIHTFLAEGDTGSR